MAFDAHDDTSDEALMVLYANGDRAAAYALTRRITPRVMAYATRMLHRDRAEAEDVVQETMLRLWRVAPVWRQNEAKVVTWAYRVATNLCTDRLRTTKRRRPTPLDDAPEVADPAIGAVQGMVVNERARALQDALAELPDRQRLAVILRHIEGLSNPEIAAIMDLGVEAVESLTARGKRTLASQLSGKKDAIGYEDD